MRNVRTLTLTFATAAVFGAACSGGSTEGNPTPSPSPSATASPITGTLTTAYGMNAPLITTANVGGDDLVLSASLDGDPIAVTGGVWACYAPDTSNPEFNYYDLIGTDETANQQRTYVVFVRFAPGVWGAGAHTVDGTDVRVYVDQGEDLWGEAASGTVTLHAAPTTSGQTCSFSTGDLTLAGERAVSSFAPHPLLRALRGRLER